MPHWQSVIVHHTLTQDRSDPLPDAVAIRRFHTSFRHYGDIISEEEYTERHAAGDHGLSRPWRDIGYHWVIETLSDGRPWVIEGRSMMLAGAHTREQGMNRKGIGVAIVGNFDLAPPEEATIEKAASFISWLCRMYHIPVDNVKAHRDYATYKSCPGEKFDMEYLRERVSEYRGYWPGND